MSIGTYAELQTAVGNWLHRADLTQRIPEFIALAEADINRELRAREMRTKSTINPGTSTADADLPTRFLEIISLNDSNGVPLTDVTEQQLEYKASSTAGLPAYYNLADKIYFERVADKSYDFTMWYHKKLALATDLTNAVLTAHPDIYLYGALLQAEPFIMNDPRLATWAGLYRVAIRAANRVAKRSLSLLVPDYVVTPSTYDINSG